MFPKPDSERSQENRSAPAPSGPADQGPSRGIEAVKPPVITLPKGGGAIRGMGEKFAANPVTGTGSISVPIATSPGRSGFGPQLSLSYDSGSGNGPFGYGWSLSLPAITRKTDKGLPRYQDGEESDTFILSGAEDLVPVLKQVDEEWVLESVPDRTIDSGAYSIKRYRPRIEGLFARIECWRNVDDLTDVHWRSISRDNVLTIYGKDLNSRIADPEDASRIFSWLICETRDDKGNAVIFKYAEENEEKIDRTQANERNRAHTANRYLKRIFYGNRTPLLNEQGSRPAHIAQAELDEAGWFFEVVFDYDEGHYQELDLDPNLAETEQHRFVQAAPQSGDAWPMRPDPFSAYRAGFEVRTHRRCRRVLMFHHIPDLPTEEPGYEGLVRATEFDYADLDYGVVVPIEDELAHQGSTRFASFIRSVTQSGYRRDDAQALVVRNGVEYATYLKKCMPPLEFEYSKAAIQQEIRQLDDDSLENLPIGLDGISYQWVDLDGEGVSGILTEQAEAWFYKPNLGEGHFGPLRRVARQPAPVGTGQSRAQFLDLAGDGQLDLVALGRPTPGFYERNDVESWENFRPFEALPDLRWDDPNLRFVDLTGDGHADILITEGEAFIWHLSLAEAGYGPAERLQKVLEEEKGPRLVFADGAQLIYLADLSGDGLTDLARIRNGEVCYWPSLGYGRFAARVTMDDSPTFDHPEQFEQGRLRLADIDGSGTTDIIYLGRGGVNLYFNRSGNAWSEAYTLEQFPKIDNLSSVMATDLLGNGTACLVWSSPLPAANGKPLRYIDLMGGQKPHLLVKTANNLGAETHVCYAPSTRFYLADKAAGRPWITRIPFPVHVIERVETYDRISRNRFVTRYAYHHGYFDGEEREFRGFGLVEQWDTEEYASLTESQAFPTGDNVDESSHVPPVLTRTWFHTGAFIGRKRISNYFAGFLDADDEGEYYREPGLTDAEARDLLLDDTVLPPGLSAEEAREACRALKGSMLRQEGYALDGSDEEPHPYTVTEQNLSIRLIQPRAGNRHAVFLTHAREAINYHYERNPADPRVQHAMTLEVDGYGNVLKDAAVGYGRRETIKVVNENGQVSEIPNPGLYQLEEDDREKQTRILVTYTENELTNAIDLPPDEVNYDPDHYHAPLPCEGRTCELTGYIPTGPVGRFRSSDFVEPDPADPNGRRQILLFDGEVNYEDDPPGGRQRRIIERVRMLYRPDDFGVSVDNPHALLQLGDLEPLALPGESYMLAFTPGLLAQVYQRQGQALLPDPAGVLRGQGPDQGGYVDLDGDGHWWIPSGRVFYSADVNDTATQERARAQGHFYSPRRYQDPFGQTTTVTFDDYDLLLLENCDPLENRFTVGERDTAGNITSQANDYRLLQPWLSMDPNRNRSQAASDTLGMVVGTAVMGKPEENLGDSLTGFEADLTEAAICEHLADPLVDPHTLLGSATTRLVYDLFAYLRTRNQPDPQPAAACSLGRETHAADLDPGQQTVLRHSFSYSDGFGREIQNKIQAEPGPVPVRDLEGSIIVGPDNQPQMTEGEISPRWVGSGWTVFNNKGAPVRQYEPFFTDTHRFEFDTRIGVSPVLFYDPAGRGVVTLQPNHTWEKVVFDPWRQETWDVNDTVLVDDPKTDPDSGDYIRRLPDGDYLPTWYAQRQGGALGQEEQDAACKAAIHAETPALAYFDSLGRTFLTVAHNKFKWGDALPEAQPIEESYSTRVILDVEGNLREIIDAKDRIVMRYDYSMLGNRIHQASMDAGMGWILNDVTGQLIRAWDSREHTFSTKYDLLRRPSESFINADAEDAMIGKTVYGESRPDPEISNLRGKVVQLFDQDGVVISDEYDFKGNLLSSRRQLAQEYKTTLDWSDSVPLEVENYISRTRHDAFGRPIQVIGPHSDQPGAKIYITQPVYNEANLLEMMNVWLDQGVEPASLLEPSSADLKAVSDIDYDAKGQRTRIVYGNGVRTEYEYDPLTFRLDHLRTLCNMERVQDLFYTYDPAGNITHICDEAQQEIYFRNQRVEPSADYTYDAIYRLIEASGREHLGQIGGVPIPHSHSDLERIGRLHPGDGNAMGRYQQEFVYDAPGNILEMIHRGTDPAHPGWTQTYTYNEPGLIDAIEFNNRLSSTQIGSGPASLYTHDEHGNITHMPHLSLMRWDFEDQLQATAKTIIDNGGTPETAYYVYDAEGQRVRKVTERQAPEGQTPTRKSERMYLDVFEVYREYESDGTTVKLERETLHIMDNQQRVALVETRTQGSDDSLPQLVRYQLGNHLGSASLELDDQAQIISYEEYFPFGNTSYQAVRSQYETPKRYRYTGKERDEETGLYYHGARYYAPWLGRWISPDPIGIEDGLNLYRYVKNSPIVKIDPMGTDDEEVTIHHRTTKKGAQSMKKHGVDTQRTGRAYGSWAGRGTMGSSDPNIPDSAIRGKNRNPADYDTVVGIKVRKDDILYLNPKNPEHQQIIALQQEGEVGDLARSQLDRDYRQIDKNDPHRTAPDHTRRDAMTKKMDTVAGKKKVVAWKNDDGTYTYIIRNNEAVREVEIAGTVKGGKFRSSPGKPGGSSGPSGKKGGPPHSPGKSGKTPKKGKFRLKKPKLKIPKLKTPKLKVPKVSGLALVKFAVPAMLGLIVLAETKDANAAMDTFTQGVIPAPNTIDAALDGTSIWKAIGLDIYENSPVSMAVQNAEARIEILDELKEKKIELTPTEKFMIRKPMW